MYRLNKVLYGIKQAPRAWYNKIDSYFRQHIYLRNETEHTLYSKEDGEGNCILISLYVDDIVHTSGS